MLTSALIEASLTRSSAVNDENSMKGCDVRVHIYRQHQDYST